MMPFGKLSRKDTEMIIIRVAHLRSCDYEMDHHRKLGKRAGLDNAAIGRIIEGPDVDGAIGSDRCCWPSTRLSGRTTSPTRRGPD